MKCNGTTANDKCVSCESYSLFLLLRSSPFRFRMGQDSGWLPPSENKISTIPVAIMIDGSIGFDSNNK